MSDYSSVQDHRSLVFDDLRNSFYSEAISSAVTEDSVVLDLGSGLGLHGLMAAVGGARKIYLIDPSPITRITRNIVEANGLADKVVCIEKKIQEIDLPEKADLIISVFTGNFLLTEDLLPSLFYARDNFLKAGGQLIPDLAKMVVVPVSAPAYYDKYVSAWSKPLHGIDFSLVQQFAFNDLYYDDPDAMKSEFLSASANLLELDFNTETEAACRSQVEVEMTEKGVCHGWLGWFDMRLGDKWLSTSPAKIQTHWRQVFLPLAEPIPVEKGQKMLFEFNRPEYGESTWIVETDGTRQQQSTFLSEPLTPADLTRKSDSYMPSLNLKGQAVREILERFKGNESTLEISEKIAGSYPRLFPTREHAKRYVINLIESFC